jgi:formamidopyrimidine-DNA glycosylase
MHFGMTGSFRVYDQPRDRPTYWKLELRTDDGQFLAMRDPRRFGRVRLLADPRQSPPIVHLGPDPLTDLPRTPALVNLLTRRHAAIKAVLLDQKLFPGVGNWIADEVLYQAGIAPHRVASDLSRDQITRLRRRLLAILRKACAVDADKTRFPADWLFHVRWGRKQGVRTIHGQKVEHQTVAGRTTAWVPKVQR